MGGSCECGSEPLSSIKWGSFLTENGLASLEGLCSMEQASKLIIII